VNIDTAMLLSYYFPHRIIISCMSKVLVVDNGGGSTMCPRQGAHWEAIGFQGSDPRTDLNRSMKMLSVLQVCISHCPSISTHNYIIPPLSELTKCQLLTSNYFRVYCTCCHHADTSNSPFAIIAFIVVCTNELFYDI
jgi:hypothetical protein